MHTCFQLHRGNESSKSRDPLSSMSVRPLRHYTITPLRHYAITPLRQYSHYAIMPVQPLRHYAITPLRHYAITPVCPLRQYASTAITPVRQYGHYAITPLRHYAITPLRQYGHYASTPLCQYGHYTSTPVRPLRHSPHSLASVKDMNVEMGFPLNLYRHSLSKLYSKHVTDARSKQEKCAYKPMILDRRYSNVGLARPLVNISPGCSEVSIFKSLIPCLLISSQNQIVLVA
jgi:hypothetical protein